MQDHLSSTQTENQFSKAAITQWLVSKFAEILGEPTEKIDLNADINSYGLGSVQLVSLIGELEDWLDLELPGTLLWDYPSLQGVIGYLVDQTGEGSEA